MARQQGKRNNWLWTLLVVENITILVVLTMLAAARCAHYLEDAGGVEPYEYRAMNIHAYPDKLTYVIGKDTELDLTGGELCYSVTAQFTGGVPCGEEREGYCDMIRGMDDAQWYSTDIDFNREGTYIVRFERRPEGLKCAFMVQVISPDYVE